MKLKNILLTTVSYVTVAALAIGGTVAYLTSKDSDVNVMTLGNVEIEQVEYERDENGDIVEFTQAKPALPAVYETEAWATDGADINGGEYKVFSEDMKNVIDKFVTVNNVGKSEAFVRTIVAIEAPNGDPDNLIHISGNKEDTDMTGMFMATIDGVDYFVINFTYKEELAAGEKSAPSLLQLFLDKKTTNEDCELFGNSWDVLVLSQAVQTAGFDTPANALNTSFGEVNEANVIEWFSGAAVALVTNEDELNDALASGKKVLLGNDVELESAVTVNDYANIDLNGHTLTTVGLNLKNGGALSNGTVTSAANTNMVPHLQISGGNVEMTDVTVEVNHHLNANTNWSEATGIDITNATAVLNNCNVTINNVTNARWTFSYGIGLVNSTLTMNGGSITATCVAGTAANGPTNPYAVSSIGDCTATLNNVTVNATYYATTVNGHLTLNTTDSTVTSANIVDNAGGSHIINLI